MIPLLLTLVFAGCQRSNERVVVYCAQDRDAAEATFAEFTGDTDLTVAPKFDTEANKSVALVAELRQEADRPRADVHWNNEPLGTIRLARQGIYRPYTSPAAADFPDWSRGKDGLYQAFAERARVIVVNTDLVPEADRPRSVFDLADPKWKGKLALAKPQFGTTATHAACLFEVLGPATAQAFFLGLKANDVAIVAGNKQVATGVGDGRFAVGLTDTDDAIIELKAGKPIALVFPDRDGHPAHPRMGTLFLPNTLAIVAGGAEPGGGREADRLPAPARFRSPAERHGGVPDPRQPGRRVAVAAGNPHPPGGHADGRRLRQGGRPVGRNADVPAAGVRPVSRGTIFLVSGINDTFFVRHGWPKGLRRPGWRTTSGCSSGSRGSGRP